MKKYVFFLGGHDAEMITIREILDTKKIPYFDKHLNWGAALSDYREELNALSKGKIPVFIELRLDISYPQRAIIIDHHNERAGKHQKTSIEQMADLLGIQLDRRQCLISANDRGHVTAMKDMGATCKEIREIREFDRQCQGVTQDDEKAAEISIQKHSENLTPDSIYIKSLTEKASPLLDRLYDKYTHIFIVTPTREFHYFGPGKMILRLEKIYKAIKQSRPDIIFWKGGYLPDKGFFGSKSALGKKQIRELFT
ncbi:MAG: hypothetical protein JSV88_08460 [Candidatus Aminicenantes bacterium]|nr:MAG: hypothetical protein JSV88_08460 [Candidatus Aminicenantes bacterium]